MQGLKPGINLGNLQQLSHLREIWLISIVKPLINPFSFLYSHMLVRLPFQDGGSERGPGMVNKGGAYWYAGYNAHLTNTDLLDILPRRAGIPVVKIKTRFLQI